MKTKRQGPDDWEDLIGETFDLLWYPGWDDPEWISLKLDSVCRTENEFGSPIYYLLEENGGGFMQYYSNVVEVRKSV